MIFELIKKINGSLVESQKEKEKFWMIVYQMEHIKLLQFILKPWMELLFALRDERRL